MNFVDEKSAKMSDKVTDIITARRSMWNHSLNEFDVEHLAEVNMYYFSL